MNVKYSIATILLFAALVGLINYTSPSIVTLPLLFALLFSTSFCAVRVVDLEG